MNIKEQYKILEFGEYGDERGNLVVAEGNGKDIPCDQTCLLYVWIRCYGDPWAACKP